MEIIPGFISLSECRDSITFHAKNINNDISSTLVNSARISSLRALLDLFEQYNSIIIEEKDIKEKTKLKEKVKC